MSRRAEQPSLEEYIAFFARLPSSVRRYFAERKHRKWMRKAPTYFIREMPENTFAKIVGHARPFRSRVLEAPVSQRRCVYYDVSIDIMSDNDIYLRTIATLQEGLPFVLQDSTAVAIIDPEHAFVSSAIDAMSTSVAYDVTDNQKALLRRASVAVAEDATLRYREAVLEIDEMVAVYGGGIREPDPDGVATMSYRDGPATRLHLTGTAKFPLLISDDPRSF
jgi:hypothetical protein